MRRVRQRGRVVERIPTDFPGERAIALLVPGTAARFTALSPVGYGGAARRGCSGGDAPAEHAEDGWLREVVCYGTVCDTTATFIAIALKLTLIVITIAAIIVAVVIIPIRVCKFAATIAIVIPTAVAIAIAVATAVVAIGPTALTLCRSPLSAERNGCNCTCCSKVVADKLTLVLEMGANNKWTPLDEEELL